MVKEIRNQVIYPESNTSPPGMVVAGHLTPCCTRAVLRKNGTRDWVLLHTLRGAAFFKQPGIFVTARAGDFVLLKPGAYHHYGPLSVGWDCLWVHFIPRPTWLSALVLPAAGKDLYRFTIRDSKARRQIRAALFRCCGHTQTAIGGFSQELAMNALEEAIFLVARENALSGGLRPLSPPIRSVLEHMTDTLSERHNLADLARVGRLSASRLTHRFKEETGESVIDYLLKLRLRQASRLLEFSAQSIKEVAYEVGFKSPFYFSRQFHHFFDMSPRQFRRTCQGRQK